MASQGGEEAGDLAAAAMWGDKELLESLLKGGADPDFPNQQGNSALHEAAYYGELECASILLDHKGREIERVGVSDIERERERERVCVSERERERESGCIRERERERVC